MNIQSLILNIDWWKKEWKENKEDHYAPACMMGGTTALAMTYWGKLHAVGFLTTAVLSYPLFHSQIEYLTYLDVHETTFAVALVGIQFFKLSFPVRLFFSVSLAYAMTMRGMKLRDAMHKLKSEIQKHVQLNEELKTQVSSLDRNMLALDQALTKLIHEVLQKKPAAVGQPGDVVIEMDFRQINEQIRSLTKSCNLLIQDKGLAEQFKTMDDNNKEIAFQTKLIQGYVDQIRKLKSCLETANQKFKDLIERAQRGEIQLRDELQTFHQWLLEIRVGYTSQVV